MAFNDNLIKVDGYSGLFFRDKKRLLGNSKLLTKKDYPKLSNEQFLDFAIRVRINYKEFKHNIKGLRVANHTIKTIIEQANKEKDELVQKARNGNRAVIDKIKYDDVFHDYLEQNKNNFSKTHHYDMGKFYGKYLKEHIGHKRIDSITTRDLQIIANNIISNGKSPRTSDKVKKQTSPVFRYAVSNGYIEKNPATDIKIPKYDNARVFEIDMDKAQKLFRLVSEYPDLFYRALFLFLFEGRRKNEVLTLEWKDIDLQNNRYFIRAQNNKVRKTMEYILPNHIKELIMAFEDRDGLVFKSPVTGKKLNNFDRRWKALLKEAGIENMRLHDIRHLIGFILVNNNISLEAIGQALGHQNLTTTKRYSNVRSQTARSVVDIVHGVLGGANG
jgi:integrase